jgi:hypothetical protein
MASSCMVADLTAAPESGKREAGSVPSAIRLVARAVMTGDVPKIFETSAKAGMPYRYPTVSSLACSAGTSIIAIEGTALGEGVWTKA